jgi:hypothetical protein
MIKFIFNIESNPENCSLYTNNGMQFYPRVSFLDSGVNVPKIVFYFRGLLYFSNLQIHYRLLLLLYFHYQC